MKYFLLGIVGCFVANSVFAQEPVIPYLNPDLEFRNPYFFTLSPTSPELLVDSVLVHGYGDNAQLKLRDKSHYHYDAQKRIVESISYLARKEGWKNSTRYTWQYQENKLVQYNGFVWNDETQKWVATQQIRCKYTQNPLTIQTDFYKWNLITSDWELTQTRQYVHQISPTEGMIVVTTNLVRENTANYNRFLYKWDASTLPYKEAYTELDMYGNGTWEKHRKVVSEYNAEKLKIKETDYHLANYTQNKWTIYQRILYDYNANGKLEKSQKGMAENDEVSEYLQKTTYQYGNNKILQTHEVQNLTTKNTFQKKQEITYYLSSTDEEQDDFSLYPNPTTGIVNLNCPKVEAPAMVWVEDEKGTEIYRQVFTTHNISTQIDMGNAPNGTYKLSLQDAKNLRTEKIVLVK